MQNTKVLHHSASLPEIEATPVGQLDLCSAESFVHGFPHGYFRRLRTEAPVCWHPHPQADKDGYLVLSKHADIRFVSKNPKLFCSSRGITLYEGSQNIAEGVEYGQHSMIYMDPPEHIRYRKLISTAFLPRRLASLEPYIRDLAEAIVKQALQNEEGDFVFDVAAELPLQVIAEFIGVPQDKRHIMFECSNKLIGAEDPEYATSPESSTEAAIALYMLSSELIEARRKEARNDIVSKLLTAEVDGQRLSEEEFSGFFVLLVNAGNETTRNQTSQGLRLLFDHPEQMSMLSDNLDDEELLQAAIEEMLRFNPPVMYFCRTATEDTEIRGVPIKAGQQLAMYYPSANRDEDVFASPDRFDIRRSPNPHLSFGVGEHFCMGASLARMQLRNIFRSILTHMRELQPTAPPALLYSHFIDGVKRLPVRYRNVNA